MTTDIKDWADYPNFSASEFVCQHTGEHGMKAKFLDELQAIRDAFGKPMRITSGYRHPSHPIEAAKEKPGTHASGVACDVAVGPGADVHRLVEIAIRHGMTGIGISQKSGSPRFVHLDMCDRVAIWSY